MDCNCQSTSLQENRAPQAPCFRMKRSRMRNVSAVWTVNDPELACYPFDGWCWQAPYALTSFRVPETGSQGGATRACGVY